MAQSVPKREEWDFSQCPDEHLEACYYYEFARESDRAKEAERTYQAAIDAAPEREAQWLRGYRLRGVYIFHQSCPEFPATPFLCIPKPERDARIAALWERTRLIQANLSSLIRTKVPGFSQAKTLKYPTDPGEGDIAAFFINWQIPLPDLVKDFRQWLEKNKPLGPSPRSKNGAGSSVRQERKRLKALGAWRLLQRMSWEEAYLHTQDVLKDKNAMNCGLFSNYPSVWEAARKEAQEAIKIVCWLIESLI